jgi:WD40 repeat protein
MYIAKKMPLQLYGSALVFCPGNSKIREISSHEVWPIVQHCSKPEGPWNTSFRTLQGHKHRVMSLSISPDGKWLATTCSNQLLIWNAGTDLLEETFDRKCDTVLFSPKGQHLATSNNLTLSIWGNATKSEREDLRKGFPQIKLQHRTWTGDVAKLPVVSSDGRRDYRRIFSAAFSPNGQWIASATCSWDVCLWDINSGQLVWSEIGGGPGLPSLAAVAFSPDGRFLGVDRALEDASIYAINVSQPQPITYRGSLSGFTCGSGIVFRPDNTSLAVPYHGVAIFDFKEQRIKDLRGYGNVSTLASSPDGQFLATQTRTGDVMIRQVTGVPTI